MLTTLKNNLRKIIFVVTAVTYSALVQAANSVIDVLVVYTQGANTAYDGAPTTRINQLFQLTNDIYRDSGVNLEIRLAGMHQVNYTDDNSAETALNDMTKATHAAFSGVAAKREAVKADMVILYRPYKSVHASCGLAWIGRDFTGLTYKNYMFSHIAMNSCPDFVTAHELGHNMGLTHSRKQDGQGGAYSYATGYGVDGQFVTIMAYATSFNVDYWSGTVYKFSQPGLMCKGLPCGVDRNNMSTGADAHYALNLTGPQISNFYAASNSSAANSSSAVSGASSSAASSKSSVAVTNVNEANTAMLAAKAAYDAAVAAVAANKIALTSLVKDESTKKAALAQATTAAKSAKTGYEAAVKKYNASVVSLDAFSPKIQAALAKYNASAGAAKDSALKAYNALVASYEKAYQQAMTDYNAAVAAQNKLSTATSALTAATNAYNLAAQASLTEKARTVGLATAVKSTLADYVAAQKVYKTFAAQK